MSEMKKRLQRRGARKGFTLVELLIVIIIIGILAGGMMLVAGSSRDSAEAARIISDLRTVKAAALMMMVDNPKGYTEGMWEDLNEDPSPLNKYLDRPLVGGSHPFTFVEDGKIATKKWDESANNWENVTIEAWLIGYDLSGVRTGVKDNLKNQAQSAGLFGEKNIDVTTDEAAVGYYDGEADTVYVIVQ
jgi:prepilin-type N-terminal cleavage/methylation domain-containing protein